MRNPERIPAVLAVVERYWRKHPDLRFGQLMQAVEIHLKQTYDHVDTYWMEEETLVRVLEEMMED